VVLSQHKKAQSLGLGIMSAIMIFIIGIMIVNFLMPEITTFRAELNCANADSISDATKLLCLVGDSVVPYWIILIFSITIGAIISRLNL